MMMDRKYRSDFLLFSVTLFGLVACYNGSSDFDALLAFKNNVEDPSNSLASWNASSTNPCNWTGVFCDLGLVVNVTISRFNLKGQVPSVIGNVSNLQVLDISSNNFSGQLPESIYNLSKLSDLLASSNSLTGDISDSVRGSVSLRHLDLSSNLLTGKIPFADICASDKLEYLALTGNQLTGSLENLSMCQSLVRVQLGSNLLTGDIPSDIPPKLTYFDVSENNLEGAIPDQISQLNLTFLILANNSLSGNLTSQLGNLAYLQSLSLQQNLFSGPIPVEFGQLDQLQHLSLHNNHLTGRIPSQLGSLLSVSYLDLSGNELTGEIPGELGQLVNLASLFLQDNLLSGSIPTSLKQCVSLLDLELGNNNLSGSIPSELGSIDSLSYGLNLSHNSLSGSIPETLENLSRLVSLDLSYNFLSGSIPSSLGNMASLLNISLAHNNLSGQLPGFLKRFPSSSYADNSGLCGDTLKNACEFNDKSQVTGGKSSLPAWAAVVIGVGATIVVLSIGVVAYGIWKLRTQEPPPEVELKPLSPEGRLFIDERLGFAFGDTVDATDILTESSAIGKGRFSSVYRVVMPNGQEVAIKRLKVDTESSAIHKRFNAELLKIDKIRHGNILKLLGYIFRGDSLMLLYEYMPNGSLGEWLHRITDSVLEWSTRHKIILGAAQGISFLHHGCHPPFVHRDINSNNILLTAAFEAQIGDVGLAKLFDPSKDTESMTAVAGSFGYIAPEYAYTMRVTEKGNVYSFGVVLLEVLTGRKPVDREYGEGKDLVSWVHTASWRNETPEQLLDASISTASFSIRQEMLSVLQIAILCTSSLPGERPKMKTVVDMLQKAKANAK